MKRIFSIILFTVILSVSVYAKEKNMTGKIITENAIMNILFIMKQDLHRNN
ncbi:hypothetical protein [uncultured Brachyspira sp.]|uniref:hypothetical protein n=1 Tax=uncultured Brachyspira sp. TaxID=221953 RepID=UPI002632F302|nr:hypothetical protein [uncultured Brachyspira sp.]